MFALAFMFAGMLIGFLLRKTVLPGLISRLLLPIICALLFAMGVLIGANHMVMDNLHTLGLHGVILALATTAASALCVALICRLFPDKKRAGDMGAGK